MAHLVRPWLVRYVDQEGKRCPKDTKGSRKVKERARKWYGQGIPGYDPKKRFPLASDKNVARQLLAELVKKAERGEARLDTDATWAQSVTLTQHLADFKVALEVRDASAKHVKLTVARIRETFEACCWSYPRDLDASALESYLASRRALPRDQSGLSVQTCNYYLQALKQFVGWMIRRKRMIENPLLDARGGNPKLDRRHDRRDLKPDELTRLLEGTNKSTVVFRGLSSSDRRALYLTACGTGFRSGEMAALTPEHFALDADPPAVTPTARSTKNKKPTAQPLPTGLAALLRDYLKDKPAGEPVWPGTWWERGSKMLAADLIHEATETVPFVRCPEVHPARSRRP